MPQRPLPTEVLHQIIASVCGEYVDFAIYVESTDSRGYGPHSPGYNPVIPLLQTSLQVRELTLKTLSEGMCIPRAKDGRLTIKPWTIISDLRRQYVFCEPNMTHLGSPNPFYVCYSLATFIVFSLRNAKTEEGDWNPHVGKALRKLAETAQIVSSCIKPDAFAEPALRRLHKDYTIATSMSYLLHLRINISLSCTMLGFAQDDNARDVAYENLHWALTTLRNWEQDTRKIHSLLPEEPLQWDLDSFFFRMAEVQYIPRDVKSVSSILPPEKYIECKTMAGDIIEYWLEKYPDLLKEWGESGIIEDESEDEDEEDEDEDEDEGEDEENEDEEDEEDEEAAIN